MPKRFDCEDEPNEYMEAPCRCDCGKWFDLEDGHTVNDKIVCRECKEESDWEDDNDDFDFDDCDDPRHPLNPPFYR